MTRDCGVCCLVRDPLRLPCALCDRRGAEDDWLRTALACLLPFHFPFLDVDLDLPFSPELW